MKTTIAFEKELNKRFEGKNGSVPVAAALRAEMRFEQKNNPLLSFFLTCLLRLLKEVQLKNKNLLWQNKTQDKIHSGEIFPWMIKND